MENSQTASNLWVSAYYDVWSMIPLGSAWWAEPPDRIDYTSGITHIIQFPNGGIISSYPYFAPMSGGSLAESLDVAYGTGRPGTPTHYRDTLIAMAHRNNVRVLLCINAVCANNLIAVLDANGNGAIDGADSARTDTLCRNAALYLSRHNYDGVDINIENGCGSVPTVIHTAMLIRRMRAYLNTVNAGIGGRMTLTLAPTSGAEGSYIASVCNANVDQINPQTYDNQYTWNGCVASNVNWYANALYPPTAAQLGTSAGCFGAGNLLHSISQHGPGRWAAAGYNKSILGIGISTYGRLRTPNKGAFQAFTGDGYAANQQGIMNGLLSNGGTLQPYDTVTKTQAITGTALQNATYNGTAASVSAGQGFYYTYPTARSVQDDVEWIKANGFSGIMLFDYQMDCDAANADVTKRNPIIHSASQAAGGGVLLPPSAPQNQTPVDAANAQPTTGLQFTWSAPFGASSYHFQIATSASFAVVLAEFEPGNNSTTVGVSPFDVGLVAPLTYYWRVNATGAGGTSAYSTPTSFSTVANAGTPPHTPVLVSPANGSSESMNTVELKIQSDPQDTIFANIFQVKSDTLSQTFIMDDSSALTSVKTVSNLTPGSAYFWRAASKNNAGKSPFSGWWSFTVTSDLWLYQDTLVSPWSDASWGSTTNFTSTENVYEGSHAIRSTLIPWGGLQFDGSAPGTTSALISTSYSTLQFMAYVSSPGLNINVFLENSSGSTFPHIVYSNVPANRWVALSFPLSQLNPNDYQYSGVAIQNYTSSSYTLFVDQIRLGGQQASDLPQNGVPASYALLQNYPNPFNPETRIQYELPADSRVRLRVFNILGQEIATLVEQTELAGIHTVTWNSSNAANRTVPSGVYFYRLDAVSSLDPQNASTLIRKMTLLK